MSTDNKQAGLFKRFIALPLYWQILVAMAAGGLVGLALGDHAKIMEIPSQVILQLLGALAPPLILVAVTHVLMTSEIRGRMAVRLAGLLLLNTTVAICIGLTVANFIQPGKWTEIQRPEASVTSSDEGIDLAALIISNLPKSILGPLGDRQNIIGVIIIAVAFGMALRKLQHFEIKTAGDIVELAYKALVIVLHWIIPLVPIGVFAVVARVVGTQGFGPFAAMGMFVIAVLAALFLQATWYLARIQFGSWVKPLDALRGVRDALVMAFSTDSSTATMPVTYSCLREKVGLREESASMGSLIGANFNNDGTALYEAMAALFVAQLIGVDLTFGQQLLVVLTSIVASVGAAGIPEAGLVTMTLVFTAVKLPIEYIGLLLTVDWFLDRCRTTINVLGDVNVSCLLDGKSQERSVAKDVEAVSVQPT